MRAFYAGIVAATLFALPVLAQNAPAADPESNLSCADYLKIEKEAGESGKSTGDKEMDALNKKVDDYCRANPTANATAYMQKMLPQ